MAGRLEGASKGELEQQTEQKEQQEQEKMVEGDEGEHEMVSGLADGSCCNLRSLVLMRIVNLWRKISP